MKRGAGLALNGAGLTLPVRLDTLLLGLCDGNSGVVLSKVAPCGLQSLAFSACLQQHADLCCAAPVKWMGSLQGHGYIPRM